MCPYGTTPGQLLVHEIGKGPDYGNGGPSGAGWDQPLGKLHMIHPGFRRAEAVVTDREGISYHTYSQFTERTS